VALSEADKAALVGPVAWHWDTAYNIDHDGEVFTAARIGSPNHVLTADSTQELREAIRRDYGAWCASLRERMST
jgi:hypothetical protein